MTQGYCTDHAALIGFLYDDCEPGERERIAAHVSSCADCTAELASLTATRRQLSEWVPPALAKATAGKPWALGFQIDPALMAESLSADRPPFTVIEGGAPEPRPAPAVSWWKQPLPAWAQAAAAVLIFAAGVGFGVGGGGTIGNAGAAAGPREGATAPVVVNTAATTSNAMTRSTVTPQELARLEQKLQAMQEELAAVRASGARGGATPGVTLAQVRELVATTETELQKQMVLRDAAMQTARREDLQRIGNLIDPLQRVHAQQLWQQGEPAQSLGAPVISLRKNVSFTR